MPPSQAEFAKAFKKVQGAAGTDGWQVSELTQLSSHCPRLLEELYGLLVRTTRAGTPQSCLAGWRVVGIPKRGAPDSRPIAVGAVIARAWSKTMMPWLPNVPEGQWSEEGVVPATLDWLAAPGQAGGEIDLAKAFDTVAHEAAVAALDFGGTPEEVVSWMLACWRSPRRCHVAGNLAEALHPTAGIPAGDPLCPRVLGVLLEPWTKLLRKKCPRVRTWAYLDDRSLKADPQKGDKRAGETTGQAAARLVEEALQLTEEQFDSKVGLTENKKKRQLWSDGKSCEHLGLSVQGAKEQTDPKAAKPRGGWEEAVNLARRVALMPGGSFMRERLSAVCVLPKIRWAAPLLEPPPWKIDKLLMRAEQRTQFTHWCPGRYWADKAQQSPTFAAAIAALKNATTLGKWPSLPATAAVAQHAAVLGLKVVQTDSEGVLVQPAASSDRRLKEVARRTALEQELPLACRRKGPTVFRADCSLGQHTCRVFARKAALQKCSPSRHDVEGVEDVDVEVLSDSRWQRWKRQLSDAQQHALKHWRAGVVAAPSRQQGNPARSTSCPHCSAEMASARHMWAECPQYDRLRTRLQEEFGLDSGWWKRQPRVTAKSGWVTYDAANTPDGRLKALLAANRLGVVIVEDCWKNNAHAERQRPSACRH